MKINKKLTYKIGHKLPIVAYLDVGNCLGCYTCKIKGFYVTKYGLHFPLPVLRSQCPYGIIAGINRDYYKVYHS